MNIVPQAKNVVRIEAMVSPADVEDIYPAGRVQVVFVVDPQRMLPPVYGRVTRLACQQAIVDGESREFVELEIEVPLDKITLVSAPAGGEIGPIRTLVTVPRGRKIVLGQVSR